MAEYYDPKTYPETWNYLQSGTIIDEYIIERELAHGGFSSVYLARQKQDQFQVAIKEYLPRRLAHRTWNNVVVPHSNETKRLFLKGRALFFEEAGVLARLKHHNIVDVTNFFQANDTVYMVMAYDYGVALGKIVKENILPVTELFMSSVFSQLLNGVECIHKNHMLHLDIKPDNILIRPDNDPLLLDFGAIQKFPLKQNLNQPKVLTQGFSPLEQCTANGVFGPWTDLYAIGASMRTCLDGGKKPPPSVDRAVNDALVPAVQVYKDKHPPYLLEAIDWAMQLKVKDRPQSVAEFQQALLKK